MRECSEHGYFRGEVCPVCGEEGKFLMNEQELEQIGRTMAGVLRHFPEKFGLEMDDQGFINLREFVNALKNQSKRYHWLRPHHIIAIIETDPKGRYQISNDMIRATYGHSIELNLRLPTENIPDSLYYPTTPEEADILLETGLKPSDRKMVHLSKTYDDALVRGQGQDRGADHPGDRREEGHRGGHRHRAGRKDRVPRARDTRRMPEQGRAAGRGRSHHRLGPFLLFSFISITQRTPSRK